MAMTAYLRKALADHAIGKTAFSMPAAVYLGLFTASPGDGGSFANEVAGGSYARQEITSKLTAFDATTFIATSTADILFPTPTADWGTVSYMGVIDPVAVKILFYEVMPVARAVVNGSRAVRFAAGQFQIKAV